MVTATEIAKIVYEDSRSTMVKTLTPADAELYCPAWENMEETQRNGLIAATAHIMEVFTQNNYDIVQITG